MTLDDLKGHYKNSYDFEKQTGFSHVNYSNWKRKGYIPIVTQLRIERVTKGLFKADVNHTTEGDK